MAVMVSAKVPFHRLRAGVVTENRAGPGEANGLTECSVLNTVGVLMRIIDTGKEHCNSIHQ